MCFYFFAERLRIKAFRVSPSTTTAAETETQQVLVAWGRLHLDLVNDKTEVPPAIAERFVPDAIATVSVHQFLHHREVVSANIGVGGAKTRAVTLAHSVYHRAIRPDSGHTVAEMENSEEQDTPAALARIIHDVVKITAGIHALSDHRPESGLAPTWMARHKERRTFVPPDHTLGIVGKQKRIRVINRSEEKFVQATGVAKIVETLIDALVGYVPGMNVNGARPALFQSFARTG